MFFCCITKNNWSTDLVTFFFGVSGSDHLRDVFGTMGLSDQDIVALSGGHTLVCSFLDVSFISSVQLFLV